MDALQSIMTRRSVRRFRGTQIDNQKIRMILAAAMQAPSARNVQSWHFIHIDDRRLLDRIAGFHPYAKMLNETADAIAVCGNLKTEPSPGYNALNCAAATQNMLLAAHALEVGGVWLGIYPREERMKKLAEVLQLPDHILPVSLVALGDPADIPEPVDRFDAGKVHHNRW